MFNLRDEFIQRQRDGVVAGELVTPVGVQEDADDAPTFGELCARNRFFDGFVVAVRAHNYVSK